MNRIKQFVDNAKWKLSPSYRNKEIARMEMLGEEHLAAMQHSFGERLYSALADATRRNHAYNLMPDGTRVKTMAYDIHPEPKPPLGPVTAWKMPKNGNSYSVLVSIPDRTQFTNGYHFVAQVDVNTSKAGKELHAITSPYPRKDEEFVLPIAQFPEFVRRISQHVERFRLFPAGKDAAKA